MRIHLRHRNLWGEELQREMEIIYQSNKLIITYYQVENAQQPLYINDMCVLENGFTVISFIEYGKWYIVDKIFNFQANTTGFLAKVVTPIEENLTFLTTMDLYVRFWITLQGEFHTFGTKMFKKVSEEGLLTETVEKGAREAIDDLIFRIQGREFPSQYVRDFILEKEP
jgi:predicted RNA-binding protein associated with RNAse of E/G family